MKHNIQTEITPTVSYIEWRVLVKDEWGKTLTDFYGTADSLTVAKIEAVKAISEFFQLNA